MNRKYINEKIVSKLETIDSEMATLKLALKNKNWSGSTGVADSISCLTIQVGILYDELELLNKEESK